MKTKKVMQIVSVATLLLGLAACSDCEVYNFTEEDEVTYYVQNDTQDTIVYMALRDHHNDACPEIQLKATALPLAPAERRAFVSYFPMLGNDTVTFGMQGWGYGKKNTLQVGNDRLYVIDSQQRNTFLWPYDYTPIGNTKDYVFVINEEFLLSLETE